MTDRELEYIKTKIKKTYKRYLGEDGKRRADISQVTEFFDIQLDNDRLGDYYVEFINFGVPSIILVDTKTMTTYKSEYTGNADILSSYASYPRYVHVTAQSVFCTIESYYHITNSDRRNRHIATKATFKNGDLELSFMDESRHNVGPFVSPGRRFAISYDRVRGADRRNLLTKIYKTFDNSSKSSLHIFNSCSCDEDLNGDNLDICTYSCPLGIDYCINKMVLKDDEGRVNSNIEGFCFENMGTYRDKKFPLPCGMNMLNEENCPELYSWRTKSAIFFRGSIARNMWCNFQVYKKDDGIHIIYKSIVGEAREVKIDDDEVLPALEPGVISVEELEYLIRHINSKYTGDVFLRQVTEHISSFCLRACINKGIVSEEEDALSPKLFSALSMDELVARVVDDRDGYFALAEEQFQESINLNDRSPKDTKKHEMKPIE